MKAREAGAIWVAGHEEEVLREGGCASVASDLGAPVRVADLWGSPLDGGIHPADERTARLLIVEVMERPDRLPRSLKALRAIPALHDAPVLAAIGPRCIQQLD